MKIKMFILSIIILCFTAGCFLGKKEEFTQYLRDHEFQEKKTCLQKTEQAEEGNFVQRFCLDECKYFAFNETLDDFFIMELDSQNIQYVYDYITYEVRSNGRKKICLFQGEEIDLNSSYCVNAERAVNQHLSQLNKELNQAGFKMKYVCLS